MHPFLRFESGRYASAEFPLSESRTRIGTDPELEMVLVDETVSARHACITKEGGAIVLEDLGSATGTFVNGARVARADLAHGDRIVIGTSTMRLVFR